MTADDRAALAALGADLVWETDHRQVSGALEELPDGSRAVLLGQDCRSGTGAAAVRLLGDGSRSGGAEPARVLLTSLMDPAADPAPELRRLYRQRTPLAACLDDFRVNPRGPVLEPRSRSVESALQELYGVVLAHYALQPVLLGSLRSQPGEPTGADGL